MRINGSSLASLVSLADLIVDEKVEKAGVYGVLHFLKDGYVVGGNGYIDIEVKTNLSDIEPFSLPASKFVQALKIINKSFEYDLSIVDNRAVIKGGGVSIKFNLVEGKADSFKRISEVFADRKSSGSIEGDKLVALPRLLKIALAGESMLELKTVLFKSDGAFSTDRVRIAWCNSKVVNIPESESMIVTASGLNNVLSLIKEKVVSIAVDSSKVYMDIGDDMYIGLLSYDVEYPDVLSVIAKNKSKVSEFIKLDSSIMDSVKNVVSIVDSGDVVLLVVEKGELRIEVSSVRGIEWKQVLAKVNTVNEYKAKVLARDLDGVIGGVVELGFAGDILYAKSVEGVEYIIACVL